MFDGGKKILDREIEKLGFLYATFQHHIDKKILDREIKKLKIFRK